MSDTTARATGSGEGAGRPATTEEALRLLADARTERQIARALTDLAPAAAAPYRDRAGRMERAAVAFLTLDHHPGVGAGGELAIPDRERADAWGLKETVDNPDRVTVGASRERLNLLDDAACVELGINAAATVRARNSLERMLAHQMAAAHRMAMKLLRRADRELARCYTQDATVEVNRLVNASARMMRAYQEGLLTLGRMRTGGRQIVTVQHVHVADGGQAVVAAGDVNGRGAAREGEGDGGIQR